MENIFNWILDNIVWEILSFLFFIFFINFIPKIFESFRITNLILKKNRETLGNGYGDHLADRFINIWYSIPSKPLSYEEKRDICISTGTNSCAQRNVSEKDDKLIELGLITIKEINGNKKVYPILNWRNKIIIKLVKFYLIKFIGDNPKYYKDKEKNFKNEKI